MECLQKVFMRSLSNEAMDGIIELCRVRASLSWLKWEEHRKGRTKLVVAEIIPCNINGVFAKSFHEVTEQ